MAGRDARRLARRIWYIPVSLPHRAAWWVDQVQRLDPPAWGIGATLPSFVASFAVGLAAAALARRTRPLAPSL